MSQTLLSLLEEFHSRKILLVCSGSFRKTFLMEELLHAGLSLSVFSAFTPNPTYEEVCAGVAQFQEEHCDTVLACGGGSAIDVAKCIKLFCRLDPSKHYLRQEWSDSGVPLIAVPTTAGTGSEATHFAVIYDGGVKQSVHHESILPTRSYLEPRLLKTLPVYQKKCTMMDALCQAIESFWSVRSVPESRGFAEEAIALIRTYGDAYIFENTEEAAAKILLASHLAGKAINLTTTTAPHAMSYKLTSLYGIPHGHAVALSLPEVWAYMLEYLKDCENRFADPKNAHLAALLGALSVALGGDTVDDGPAVFRQLLRHYALPSPVSAHKAEDLSVLVSSVNPERLNNNPVALTVETLHRLYDAIVKEGNAP